MRTRPLGTTGIEVSEVGLGAWQLGSPGWQGPDGDEALRLVDEALRLGVTFFDTAPIYGRGRSEELLGEALEGRREGVVLCTKFGSRADGTESFSAADIEPALEESLTRLRTDHVDVLLLHNPPTELLDGSAPQYAELERMRGGGWIRAYGVSLDSRVELERVLRTTKCGVVEVLFNAFHQEPLPAIEEAIERGVGVVANSPLDSGWLTGKYRESSTFGGVRGRWSPEEIVRRAQLVRRFEECLPSGSDVAQGALRFVLSQAAVSTVIPGAKSVAQVQANAAASDADLADSSVEAIRRLWEDEIRNDPVPW